HVSYGFDIKRDFDDPDSRTLGTEIVTTSITSGGDGSEKPSNWNTLMTANPHLKFFNGLRGYATVSLDRRSARADFKTVSHVTGEGAPLTTAGSFVTEAGEPGLKPA
ncbi:alkaline phosphatase, partial [Streptomyces sp. SID6648]|nr:alkaline phosphatase [Streptomyces sp. SID6648]